MRSCTPIHIRYSETDMMGVVYHANYLLYLEDARTRFLEEAGIPYTMIEKAGYVCPVRSLDVAFGEPLRYGEECHVVTRIVEARPSRTVYEQQVMRGAPGDGTSAVVASAHVTCCIVDRKTFKPTTFKRALPDLYARCLEVVEPCEG